MLLSLAMIVRDEEEMLPGCLASARAAVDEIVVVDTGSADRSVEIAEEFGARILHAPWRGDFSAARNVGLAAAGGRWILVMDADERFEGDPKRLRRLLAKTRAVALDVPIRNEVGDGRVDVHSALRVFRHLPGIRFERRLHEQIFPTLMEVTKGGRIEKAPFALRHLGYRASVVERKGKRARNLELAKQEVAAQPFDPFAAFNLGIEYTALRDLEAGIAEFRRARALTGSPQSWQSRLYKTEVQSLYQLERYDEALQLIAEALPVFPEYTDLFFLRGLAQEALGDRREAEAAWRHCLRLGPAKTPPYDGVDPLFGGAGAATALGGLLMHDGRLPEALQLLRTATREAPGFMPAVQGLVECSLLEGQGIEALLAEQPPDPLEIGAALFRARRYELAVQAFTAGELQHRDLPPDHFLAKAVAALRANDVASAAEAVARAGEGAHSSPRAYVIDLVEYALGKMEREALAARYAPEHAIWRDIPPDAAQTDG